jgi:putative iron-dependent peroxidase
MLENMFVGNPPGTYDHLLDFSRAVTGCLFFVPTASFLDDVGPSSAVAKDPAMAREPSQNPSPADGSLGIGSLRKEAEHE